MMLGLLGGSSFRLVIFVFGCFEWLCCGGVRCFLPGWLVSVFGG